MATNLTPAETAELQQMQLDSLAKLRLRDTATADQFVDCLRDFIKHEKFREEGLRYSRRSERKQIAEDFLDSIRPDGRSNRDFFWPNHDVSGVNTWPGELRVQGVIADWIYMEVGKKPGKRPQTRENTIESAGGEQLDQNFQGPMTSNDDDLDNEEGYFSPDGDIPHSEEPSETVIGKRKSTEIDIYDFNFDEYLPRGDGVAAEKSGSRPRKLLRFTSQTGVAEQSQTRSEREAAQPISPPSLSRPRIETGLQAVSTDNMILQTPNTGTAREESTSSVSPEAARTPQTAQIGTVQPSNPPLSVTRPTPEASQALHRPPRSTVSVPQIFTIAEFAHIPCVFLERMEAKERVYYDEAHASENFGDIKLALTKARVLRDMRDELKDLLKSVRGRANTTQVTDPGDLEG
jgi:hypothetical protein